MQPWSLHQKGEELPADRDFYTQDLLRELRT